MTGTTSCQHTTCPTGTMPCQQPHLPHTGTMSCRSRASSLSQQQLSDARPEAANGPAEPTLLVQGL